MRYKFFSGRVKNFWGGSTDIDTVWAMLKWIYGNGKIVWLLEKAEQKVKKASNDWDYNKKEERSITMGKWAELNIKKNSRRIYIVRKKIGRSQK